MGQVRSGGQVGSGGRVGWGRIGLGGEVGSGQVGSVGWVSRVGSGQVVGSVHRYCRYCLDEAQLSYITIGWLGGWVAGRDPIEFKDQVKLINDNNPA